MFFAFLLFRFSISMLVCLEVTAELKNSGLKSSHSHVDSIFRELSLFEFVTPAILTRGRWRRDMTTRTTVGHREVFVLKLQRRSNPFVLDLTRNRDLLPSNFVSKHYDNKGKLVTTRPQHHDHCFYQGSLRGVANSVVSISTCKGIEGLIQDGNESYYVQPVNKEGVRQHILYNMKDLIQKETKCGQGHSMGSWNLASVTHNSPFIKYRARRNINTEVKYVELVLVNDFAQFTNQKRDVKETEYRGKHIVNLVDSLYRPLNVRVALLMMITWSNGNKIRVEANSDNTLSNFLKYKNKDIVDHLKTENINSHDNAQLLSASKFAGSTVGKAQVMAMCSKLSAAVVKDHSPNAAATAATFAHEMGHNFGLNHDDDYKRDECMCSKDTGCIMSGVARHKPAIKWSQCSHEEFQKMLKRGLDSCLFNQPRRLYGDAVCGNGFKEEGEECDCGTLEECKRYSDNCCNTTTCKLHSYAECGEGPCCSKCKFKSAGTECREKINNCDVPEQCNGKSELCPENVYVQNGWPCDNGYCFNGRCPSHDQQCEDLWGKGAKNAEKVCYTSNVKGKDYASCGINSSTNTFIKCKVADMKCGKVWCEKESKGTLPIIGVDRYGYKQRFRSLNVDCWSAKVDMGDDVPDPTLAMNGAKCGDDKICHENKCIHIHEFSWQLSLCPNNCSGNGVCTTKDECFCDPCWGSSDCATSVRCPWESEARTSIAGIVIAIFIILLLIVGAVLAFKNRQLLYQKWQNYNKKQTGGGRYNHVSTGTPRASRSDSANRGRAKPQDNSMQPSKARLEISGPVSADTSTPATVVTPTVTTTPKPPAVPKSAVNGASNLPGWPTVNPQQKPVFTAKSWQEEPRKKPMWKPPVEKDDNISSRPSSGVTPPKKPEWPPKQKEGDHVPPKKPIWPPRPNRASSPPGAFDDNPAVRPPPKPRPGSHAGILNQEKPALSGRPGSDPQLAKKPSFGGPRPSPLARKPSGAQEIDGAGRAKAKPPGLPVSRKPSGAKNLDSTHKPGTAPSKPPLPLGRKLSGAQDLDGAKKPFPKPLKTPGALPGRPISVSKPTGTPIVPAGAKKPPPVGKVPILPPGKHSSSR